jgi:ABC-type uncharacterized transport system substrate-binding protein
MRRREFITLLGGAAVIWPLAVRAQQPDRVRRIGAIIGIADDVTSKTMLEAFRQGLEQLGWIDGRNVRIDARFGGGDPVRVRKHAAELVVSTPDVILATIAAFASQPNGGLIVTGSASTLTHRELINTLAAKHKLPAVAPSRYYVTSGVLISYGVDFVDQHRRAAAYVDRILKGEKPGDMPVQAPTKYELVINLKTAKAMGLTIPPSVLARADEVIE